MIKIYQFTYIDILPVISRFQQFSCLFAFVCVLKLPDVLIFNNIDECSSSIGSHNIEMAESRSLSGVMICFHVLLMFWTTQFSKSECAER